MSTITNPSKPYTFTNGTVGEAPEVNSDFDIIYAKAMEIIAALNNIDAANITVGTLALARIPTGSGAGLDADKVDSFHASQTPGANQIPVTNAGSDLVLGGEIILPNNNAFQSKETGGTTRTVAYLSATNVVNLGDNNLATDILSSGATNLTHNNSLLWDAANDGSGSGLDADKLDGQEGAYYLPAGSYTASDVLTKVETVDGSGSGLDADKLDGQEGAYYLPAGSYTASDVLSKIQGVDGSGSGLDADMLDGQHAIDIYAKGYLSVLGQASIVMLDATTYFIGVAGWDVAEAQLPALRIMKSGSIKMARMGWKSTAAPSSESVSVYLRKNASTDTLIGTIGDVNTVKYFENVSLDIAVSAGDSINLKIVCPTWATNPGTVAFGGHIWIE